MAFYDDEKINKKVLFKLSLSVIERAILDAQGKHEKVIKKPSGRNSRFYRNSNRNKDKMDAIDFLKKLDRSIFWDILDLDGEKWGKIKTLAGLV